MTVKVVDADTLDLRIDCGFYIHVETRVRLARVDAWEIRGQERPQGLQARERVLQLLMPGEEPTPIRVRTEKTGKYGRWIAEVELPDGDNLSDLLVREGHAEYVQY